MDATAIHFLVPSSSWRFAWVQEITLEHRQRVCTGQLVFPGQFAGAVTFPAGVSPRVSSDFLLSAFESRGLCGLPFACC